MSLRDTEPVPSRVLGLLHTALILTDGNKGLFFDKQSLLDLSAPASHVNPTIFDKVFNECLRWDFFTQIEGNQFAVPSIFIDLLPSTHIGRASEAFVSGKLSDQVRRHILQKLRANPETDQEFTRLLAWLLMQDGKNYPLTEAKLEGLSAAQDTSATRFLGWTTERNAGLVRWAHFLGFLRQHSLNGRIAYQPDPTQALSWEFDTWLLPDETNNSVSIAEVLNRLERYYPWLENGMIARQVRDNLVQPPAYDDSNLSAPLSLALLRLSRTNHLNLQHFSDATHLRRVTWGPSQTVSHLQRTQGAK